MDYRSTSAVLDGSSDEIEEKRTTYSCGKAADLVPCRIDNARTGFPS